MLRTISRGRPLSFISKPIAASWRARQAEIDLKGLQQVIAFMGEGGTIKQPLPAPEQFVDLQYLRATGVE